MKNIDNAYLVLSVAEIKAMLHAAELEQALRGDFNDRVSLVLRDISIVYDGTDRPQIAAWSVAIAARVSAQQAETDLAIQTEKQVIRSEAMNHPDAAI